MRVKEIGFALRGTKIMTLGLLDDVINNIQFKWKNRFFMILPQFASEICDGKCGPMAADRWARAADVRETKKFLKLPLQKYPHKRSKMIFFPR